MSDAELLNYIQEHGMLELAEVRKQIEMAKRKELLAKHPYEIWENKNGIWHTYLPDEEKGRVQRKSKSKTKIEDIIIGYWQDIEMRPCFVEVYEKWISEKIEFNEVGKNTITRYDNVIKSFFPKTEPFCKIKLVDMTDSELERFIKKTICENHLSKKSYEMLRLVIRGVFKYAKREGYTNYSITTFFSDLSLPSNIFSKKIKDPSLEVFNTQDAKKMMDYLLGHPTIENLALALCFMTGLRVGELSALKIEDNVRPKVIKVCRTEIEYQDHDTKKRIRTIKEYPKTDCGVRFLMLTDEGQRIWDMIVALNPNGNFLFERDGVRIRTKWFNYYLGKACEEIGIPKRSVHKIRHTYGSKLLANGVEETIVTKQLGHKDISTTHEYYHFDISTDSDRMEILNKAVVY